MEFSRGDVERALAEVELPEDLAREVVPPTVLRSLEDRRERVRRVWRETDRERDPDEDEERELRLLTRSTLLTYAVVSEIQNGEVFVPTVPGAPAGWTVQPMLRAFGSVGLIDPQDHLGAPIFGVSLKVPYAAEDFWSFVEWASVEMRSLFLPRLRMSLPLSVVRVEEELHRVPHLTGATTTCHAVRGDRPGIIVAGHSVAHSHPGDVLGVDGPMSGRLVRSGYRPIDAAFIELPHRPALLKNLPVIDFPTIGDEVIVQTRGGDEHRRVAQVSNSIVSPGFSDYPIVLYLDRGCRSGDSGALVRLARTGEAVGIYTGTHIARDPDAAEPLGTAQNMAQAMYTLGATPKE